MAAILNLAAILDSGADIRMSCHQELFTIPILPVCIVKHGIKNIHNKWQDMYISGGHFEFGSHIEFRD